MGSIGGCGKWVVLIDGPTDEVEEGLLSQGWTRAGDKEGGGGEEGSCENSCIVESGKRVGRSRTVGEETSFTQCCQRD